MNTAKIFEDIGIQKYWNFLSCHTSVGPRKRKPTFGKSHACGNGCFFTLIKVGSGAFYSNASGIK